MIVCEILTYRTIPEGDVRTRHLEFLRNHGRAGRIIMAGRFADAKGAMVLWNVRKLDVAKEMAEQDPYVKEGFLAYYELREWPVMFNYTVKPAVEWSRGGK